MHTISERERHRRREQSERQLWAVADFAAAHGISIRQVYALLAHGLLKGVRVGRRTLVTDESRRAWLESLPPFQSGSPLMCGAAA